MRVVVGAASPLLGYFSINLAVRQGCCSQRDRGVVGGIRAFLLEHRVVARVENRRERRAQAVDRCTSL